ncbi:carboxylesterase [Aspergillus saccharolyticus JOP 1030-1]|uniref:Carboxylesterase n=1 Tax=Aspergillus saccharolyticus JOP 1030-1 TaxID=1450539 RepID=A0A318ZQ27_9EURO|nr:carboxylesterase [Aspergillus saccharolyticus JOP 1030-1]PYH48725.1 carboxylesterase [Aspergillus saccharolyticus JOP 1030-1]
MFSKGFRASGLITAILGLATGSSASPIAPGSTIGEGLLVQTSSGPVQGFVNLTTPDVRQFLGIPFAEPPVGNLRFARPVPKSPNGTVDAFALPSSCMQQTSNSTSIYTEYETGYLIDGGDSEDCLYLSIWAPKVDGIRFQQRPLPVLLYVPGGGFTSGGQASLYKIPDNWVQRTQSHIVVILNYRVNVFGFPNAEGLEDQNAGLLDQRLAVEWVHQNIANFGGDPERITFWGQSAGGGSVSLYTYSYPENPIVAAIAADSGAPGLISFTDYAHTNFTFLAGLVGCGGLNSSAELSCVRSVPATTLQTALSTYAGTPSISFKPSVDNVTVFANWTQRALEGKVAKIPMLIGSNTNEGAGFVSFTPDGPGAATLLNLTESIIACPVAEEVKNRNLVGLPTYRYQYAGNFSNISPLPWFGAYHSSELPLLFGTHSQYGGSPSTQFEWEVSYAMEALWLSFAEAPSRGPVRLAIEGVTGNPNNASVFEWPEFEQREDNMVLFAEDGVLMQLVSADRIDDYC